MKLLLLLALCIPTVAQSFKDDVDKTRTMFLDGVRDQKLHKKKFNAAVAKLKPVKNVIAEVKQIDGETTCHIYKESEWTSIVAFRTHDSKNEDAFAFTSIFQFFREEKGFAFFRRYDRLNIVPVFRRLGPYPPFLLTPYEHDPMSACLKAAGLENKVSFYEKHRPK